MELQFEIQMAINTILDSGYTLHNIPSFVKENISTGFFYYKPDVTSNLDEVKQFIDEIALHWQGFNLSGQHLRNFTSNIQLLDLYKYRDLKFIYNLIVDKNIADYVNNFNNVLRVFRNDLSYIPYVITSGVPQQVIEPILYVPSGDGLLEYLKEKLTFEKLIKLYTSSFDNRILGNKYNELIYVKEGKNLQLIDHNVCVFTEEAKANKITDPYDSRIFEPPVLDKDNKPKDVICLVETNRTKGLGFYKGH